MIPTKKRIRAKAKKRNGDIYAEDKDRRIRLRQRISVRAHTIIDEQIESLNMTKTCLFDAMVKNYIITGKKVTIPTQNSPRGIEFMCFIHPIYERWIRKEATKRGVSFSTQISQMIEHYHDNCSFELNIFNFSCGLP